MADKPTLDFIGANSAGETHYFDSSLVSGRGSMLNNIKHFFVKVIPLGPIGGHHIV